MSETIAHVVVVWQEKYLTPGYDWCWMMLPYGHSLPHRIRLASRADAIQDAMRVCGKEIEIVRDVPQ